MLSERLNMIVIEDNREYRMGLVNDLRKLHHEVAVFDNENKAIEYILTQKYDMAFVDLDLNGNSLAGLKVLKVLKDRYIYSVIISDLI